MKVSKVSYYGFEEAIRGARNSYDSWNRSDSCFGFDQPKLGEKDLALLSSLAKAGGSEAKALRYIWVYMDIEGSLNWWKQFDTYRLGRVDNPNDIEENSCSTMHTLMKRYPLKKEDFDLIEWAEHEDKVNADFMFDLHLDNVNRLLEYYRMDLKDSGPDFKKALEAKIFDLLPMSFIQRRTVMLNYATLRHIVQDRKYHKLRDWHVFMSYIRQLPYAKELIF